MDLGVAGVGEHRAAPVRPPDRRGVAALGVGGQEEHVAVAAGGQHDRVGQVRLDLAGDHVADDDAARPAVEDDQVEHLVAGVHLHGPGRDLPLQRLVGAEQQLLARLAAGVEGPGDLRAAEGAGVEQAAVLAGERHALGHGLVDDVRADLGEPVDVGLPGAEVAALDGVVEQPVDRVAVVAVVLGRVDAALGGDGVRAAGRVLVAERLDVVAQLAEGRGGRAAGQAGADDDDVELALVGRVDQLGAELALLPALLDRPVGSLGVADRLAFGVLRDHCSLNTPHSLHGRLASRRPPRPGCDSLTLIDYHSVRTHGRHARGSRGPAPRRSRRRCPSAPGSRARPPGRASGTRSTGRAAGAGRP